VKWTTAIFAIYLLLLSLVPCADNDMCENGTVTNSEQAPSDDKERDTCTPFCICSCCHNIISIPSIPRIEPLPIVTHMPKPETGYVANAIKDMTIEFFQPPRLG